MSFHSPQPPPSAQNRHSILSTIFLGPNGLRAGWRLLIFLALFLSCLAAFRSLAIQAPRVARLLDPLRRATLTVPAALTLEFAFVVSLLVATFIMSKIEKRPLGDYGLPARAAFGKLFCQGVLWGLAAVSALILLIYGFGGFSLGTLALSPARALGYAAGWALVFLMTGFFEEFLFRGYAQFTLASGIGFWPAAFLLSALFGFVHSSGHGEIWVGGVAAGLFALFLCVTLKRFGNLWFAWGFHSGFIWGETFLFSVPNSGFASSGHLLNSSLHGPPWLTGGSVGPEASVMLFVVLAGLFFSFRPRAAAPRATP